jgi:hypothetical protein
MDCTTDYEHLFPYARRHNLHSCGALDELDYALADVLQSTPYCTHANHNVPPE